MRFMLLFTILSIQMIAFNCKAQDMNNFELTDYLNAVNSDTWEDAEDIIFGLTYLPLLNNPVQNGNEWVYHYDRANEYEEERMDDLFLVTDKEENIKRIEVKGAGVSLIAECKALLTYKKIYVISRQDENNFTFKLYGYNNLFKIKFIERSDGLMSNTLIVYRN